MEDSSENYLEVFFMTAKSRKKIDYILLCERIVLIISPIILLLIQSLIAGKNLFMGVPVWSDELDYWREMYSFSGHGFGFGGSLYVGMEPELGPMGAHSVSPIFAWGLFLPLFKSAIGTHIILWANLFMLIAALTIFVLLVKPGKKLSAAAIAIFTLYPMMLHYLGTSMIEIMCIAGITIFFSLFYKWNENGDNKWFYILLIVGIWCVFLRITYIVILFPVIWKKCDFSFKLKAFTAMLVYVAGFAVFYKLYNIFCAGYPEWTTQKLSNAAGIKNKLYVLLQNTKLNLSRFLSPISDDRAQVGMRYFYLLLMIFVFVLAFTAVKTVGRVDFLYLSIGIMMLGLLGMMMVLYDIKDWRDFRTFAPIGFGVFVFVLCKERRGTAIGILSALFVFVSAMSFSSGVNLIKNREAVSANFAEINGSAFEKLELTDASGKARAIGTDERINWGNIDFMKAVPSKLGVKIFYGEINENNIEAVDYVFISSDTYEGNRALFDSYEIVENIDNWGLLIKTFK